nr:protein vascular associated death 1, chloroplastic [Tanacetum cinerariifolium]
MAVATTSDSTAPPSQSMDKSPPLPPSPPTTTTESSSPVPVTGSPSSAGNLDPVESSSSSPSRNKQLDMQPSLRSEEYRQLFRLPPEEVHLSFCIGVCFGK